MQYRKFGKTGWDASVLGFGYMRLPTIGGDSGKIDQEKAEEMVNIAIEGGVNYFDTAYVYHEQQSEISLGIALKGKRDKVRIATKLPIWLCNESADFDKILDEELQRLQTDHIDFYLMHALNKYSWEKVKQLKLLERSENAISDGRIRHVGFSFHDSINTFKRIINEFDKWTFCQIQYNYLDTDVQAGTEGLQYAADHGLAVVIMEPLRGGKLALDLPPTRSIWESMPQKRTPADWALQWVWNHPEVSVVLSGMSTLEQVKQNLASADQSQENALSTEEMKKFIQAKTTLINRSPIPCTSCEYCLPCPSGVNIPWNIDVYNRVAMFDDLQSNIHEYVHVIGDDQKAAQCIQCEECLPKCPQDIEISSWMPVIDEVFSKGQPYQMNL
jgi:predicted aldo/keto reductase-like oxidoreductase